MKRMIVLLSALGLAVSAPVLAQAYRDLTAGEVALLNSKRQAKMIAAQHLVANLTAEEAVTRAQQMLSNTTRITYNDAHGVEVEFHAANGSTYLWYAGNVDAVTGKWKTRVTSGQPLVCYTYFNAYNPVTGQSNTTDCWNVAPVLGKVGVIVSAEGDLFNLASGRIPYRRRKLTVPVLPNPPPPTP
jgi:hypothetical protein